MAIAGDGGAARGPSVGRTAATVGSAGMIVADGGESVVGGAPGEAQAATMQSSRASSRKRECVIEHMPFDESPHRRACPRFSDDRL
jgi:hypothetical protein